MDSWNEVFNGQFSSKRIKSNETHDDDWIEELKSNIKIIQDTLPEIMDDLCDIKEMLKK